MAVPRLCVSDSDGLTLGATHRDAGDRFRLKSQYKREPGIIVLTG